MNWRWPEVMLPINVRDFSPPGLIQKTAAPFAGQTNDEDFSEWIPYLDVVLKHQNTEGPSALVYTHPGIAAYMGMNNAGLSVLWQYIDNGERAADGLGVPTNCIIRELLFYDDLDDAVAFSETSTPHHSQSLFDLPSHGRRRLGGMLSRRNFR